MAFQIILNIILAVIWMLLHDRITLLDFFIGYSLGIILFFIMRRFLRFDFYFTRVIAIIYLILIFIKELIITNIDVAKIVLSKDMNINPGIIVYPTDLKRDWEVVFLASIISLTPGTITMAFSDDGRTIYIHSLHIEDKEEAINRLRHTFEKTIMEVSH
ncbi:Na(+) H(+) antiporter subunit E [Candidatus Syntrophocurvum alkaliphilum]|uniref:Na(+) H(+) antiporter subunit E n=1 Tax=Candidatus Syntrophocurvum alkaliphilum TaxID=2293317 RepID=A0A6I6DDW2_9FIRM|nr:Na+/H+ antiporter subunit E [Candidatus Syntrophocurvum alkaliphilum]QGT99426.1 Na(+) H(+) antiporter subunit E [Candidatus Syntrophocurvum alkaliphilum]